VKPLEIYLNFDANLVGKCGYYALFYKLTPNGDKYGESTALLVKDDNGKDIIGCICNPIIPITFNFDTNTQGGYEPNTPRQVVLVYGKPGTCKPGLQNFLISPEEPSDIKVSGEIDTGYRNDYV